MTAEWEMEIQEVRFGPRVPSGALGETQEHPDQTRCSAVLEVRAILRIPTHLDHRYPPEMEIAVRLPTGTPPAIHATALGPWALALAQMALSDAARYCVPGSPIREGAHQAQEIVHHWDCE